MRMILVSLSLLLVACGGGGTATGATCPTGSTLTYDNFGRTFFQSYCNRCHSAGTRPTLSTVAELRAQRTLIDQAAAAGPMRVNTYMPDGMPTPTDEERRQLGEWLACGAP